MGTLCLEKSPGSLRPISGLPRHGCEVTIIVQLLLLCRPLSIRSLCSRSRPLNARRVWLVRLAVPVIRLVLTLKALPYYVPSRWPWLFLLH